MIVTFGDHIKTLSGKSPDNTVVYHSYKNDTVCVMKRYVKPRTTDHNRECGQRMKRVALLYKEVSQEFKESLKLYASLYNKQLLPQKKAPLNAFNIFVKALCKGIVHLKDLDNIESIVNLYGGCINNWISNGLLDKVKGKIPDVNILPNVISVYTVLENKVFMTNRRNV